MKICILGNSKRHRHLYESLKSLGYEVDLLVDSKVLPQRLTHEVIVLPIPTLNGRGKLNLETDCPIEPEELLSRLDRKSLVITCNFESKEYNTIDLNKRDDFAYLNAIPTAEGAIYHAIDQSETSLFEQKILITGFGRVAKLLADRIKGMASDVTIAARSRRDKSYARALGFNVTEISELKNCVRDFNLIFQTVPALILGKDVIDTLTENTQIIELSSKSMGTDCDYANLKGISVINAAALPEKIAPKTAGNILTKTVLNILDEQLPKSGDLFGKY